MPSTAVSLWRVCRIARTLKNTSCAPKPAATPGIDQGPQYCTVLAQWRIITLDRCLQIPPLLSIQS